MHGMKTNLNLKEPGKLNDMALSTMTNSTY